MNFKEEKAVKLKAGINCLSMSTLLVAQLIQVLKSMMLERIKSRNLILILDSYSDKRKEHVVWP